MTPKICMYACVWYVSYYQKDNEAVVVSFYSNDIIIIINRQLLVSIKRVLLLKNICLFIDWITPFYPLHLYFLWTFLNGRKCGSDRRCLQATELILSLLIVVQILDWLKLIWHYFDNSLLCVQLYSWQLLYNFRQWFKMIVICKNLL